LGSVVLGLETPQTAVEPLGKIRRWVDWREAAENHQCPPNCYVVRRTRRALGDVPLHGDQFDVGERPVSERGMMTAEGRTIHETSGSPSRVA
jgi:hypothetical protein